MFRLRSERDIFRVACLASALVSIIFPGMYLRVWSLTCSVVLDSLKLLMLCSNSDFALVNKLLR